MDWGNKVLEQAIEILNLDDETPMSLRVAASNSSSRFAPIVFR